VLSTAFGTAMRNGGDRNGNRSWGARKTEQNSSVKVTVLKLIAAAATIVCALRLINKAALNRLNREPLGLSNGARDRQPR